MNGPGREQGMDRQVAFLIKFKGYELDRELSWYRHPAFTSSAMPPYIELFFQRNKAAYVELCDEMHERTEKDKQSRGIRDAKRARKE